MIGAFTYGPGGLTTCVEKRGLFCTLMVELELQLLFFLAFDDTYYESWGYCNDSSTANIMLSSIKARRVFATILTSKNIKYY